MAGNTISITFKLEGDSNSFKNLTKDAEGLKKAMSGVIAEGQQLKGNVINFAALATGIDAAQRSFSQLQGAMQGLADAYAVQEVAETKLTTVMQQRMGATDAEIQSIKDLAAAQQEIGVIGDEVQLSGAQQIATFLTQKDSLEALVPAMNNLLAQQKGLNATTGDAVQVGNLMGKAMMGQVDALKRVGITFTEAEANVMKYGTEQERAAMLAQIITNNVGEMNAQLAQTESGKQQQLANAIGDVKEQIGGLVNGALPFVTIAAQSTAALASITTLITGVKTLSAVMYANAKAFAVSTAAYIKNKVATLAAAAAQGVVRAATMAWKAAQVVLNVVLSANPIGLVIMAIGALVSAVVYAYNNCESFRKIVNQVWEAIKPLATAIMDGLAKAFEWLVVKCKEAWEWLKNILGLGNKKVSVAVDVSKPKGKAPTIDLGDAQKKYANAGNTPKTTTPKISTPKAESNAPVWREDAATLEQINENLDVLRARLQKATVEEAADINQQIALWQAKADAIEDAGNAVSDHTPLWKEDATTLKDINANIQILQDRLNEANVEEAATINQQIAMWTEKANAIKNAGKAVEDNTPKWNAQASTLKDINANIQILQDRLQTANVQEAAALNQEIELWNKKAEAIKKAGLEAESTGEKNYKAFTTSWGAVKGMKGGIDNITDALKGNGDAWTKVCGIIDGFVSMYNGIQTVIGIINLLTAASTAHSVAKGVEATSEGTEAGVRATAAATNSTAAATTIVANKLEAASWKELAAAKYMAAHASIPFVGYGIAAGFVAAMIATVTAAGVPMLANGGLATGPTLAMVGEYAGASGNPEVIAPLDKLRSLLPDAPEAGIGELEFRIKGDDLVAVYNRRTNKVRRS